MELPVTVQLNVWGWPSAPSKMPSFLVSSMVLLSGGLGGFDGGLLC